MNITTQTTTIITITISFLHDFCKFLREQKALIAWMTNFEQSVDATKKLESLLDRQPESWIKGAFVWASTPEQHSYWNKLSRAWEAHLIDIEKAAVREADKKAEVVWKGTE